MIRGVLGWKCIGVPLNPLHPTLGCGRSVRVMESSSLPSKNPKQHQRNYRKNGGGNLAGAREGSHDDGSEIARAGGAPASAGSESAGAGAGAKPGKPSFGGKGSASQNLAHSPWSPLIQFGTVPLETPVSSDAPSVAVSSRTDFPQLRAADQAQASTKQRVSTQGWDKAQPGKAPESEAPPPPPPPAPTVEVKAANVPRAESQVPQKRPSGRDSGSEGLTSAWPGRKSSVPASQDLKEIDDDFPPLGSTSLPAKGRSSGKGGFRGLAEQGHNADAHLPVPIKAPESGQQSEVESVAGDKEGQTDSRSSHVDHHNGRKGGNRFQGVEQRGGRGGGGGGEWRNNGRRGGREPRDGWQDGQGRDATFERQNSVESLGRLLTRILRHQAHGLDLKIRSDGYVDVQDLLKLSIKTRSNRSLSSHTVDDIWEVVKQDKKQRFGTKEENGKLLIRANQGHTIESVESEHLLKPILSAADVPVCVHGTYRENLDRIFKQGLKRMGRNHIHFATGKFGKEGVISGMRSTCEVLIHLNVKKALDDGMKLYISENGVILTEGFDGVVAPKYFGEVLALPGMKPIAPR